MVVVLPLCARCLLCALFSEAVSGWKMREHNPSMTWGEGKRYETQPADCLMWIELDYRSPRKRTLETVDDKLHWRPMYFN